MKKLCILTAFVFCVLPLVSWALPIDLDTFTAIDPAYVIDRSPTHAKMIEDPDFFNVMLFNDDLSAFLSPGDTTIEFEYNFYLDFPDNQDELNYYVYLDGDPWDRYDEGFISVTSSGTASLNISNWTTTGATTLGLEFDFNSYPAPNDMDFDSWVEIDDPRIVGGEAPIPEASTLILFGSGGLSLLGLYRPWRRRR